MKITTWNINSIRLRLLDIINFLKSNNVDVLCLQETKIKDELFPVKEFNRAGYPHLYYRGQKSYNGVAIISKLPIIKKNFLNFINKEDTRHISVLLDNGITIHNFYVPAGGDVPDIKVNDKFDYKIKFVNAMIEFFKNKNEKKMILVGDLNIAPLENDVWSHKQLLKVVSHTEIEIKLLNKLINNCNFIDIPRMLMGNDVKLYSWWSYRNKDWKKSNRGRRLDHILATKDILSNVEKVKFFKNYRDKDKPSDHIPISVDINFI